jgi:hypothetical protein
MRKHDKRTLLLQKLRKKGLAEDLVALLPPPPPRELTVAEEKSILGFCDGLLATKKDSR